MYFMDDIIFSFPGDKNVPIGNYTSQWSGNFYLSKLDNFVKHVLKCKDYVRYCDDFILFSNDKKYLHYCREQIQMFIENKLLLSYSRADVFNTEQGVDFCGYRMFGKYILLRKSTALRLKRKLVKVQNKVYEGILTKEKASSIIGSYNGLLKHANTYNLKQKIGFEKIKQEYKKNA